MRQHIIFDLDDTLIYCNRYFYAVIDQFVAVMQNWFQHTGITDEHIRQKQAEIDLEGVMADGFKSNHFPQSFVLTYRFFIAMTAQARSLSREKYLFELGKSVYQHQVEPYPFMEQTLATLAEQGHDLHLYTGGQSTIQERKIKALHLERYFHDRIYVRTHKNIDAMESILTEQQLDRSATWMIGNSMRTDVLPALTAGIHAIHIEAASEWVYNIVDINVQPKGAFFKLDQLVHVPQTITNYIRTSL